MKRCFTYTILLITIVHFHLQAQGWEWQNPLPHGQTVNDIVMFDATVGVAACNNGYYLYTANSGRNWNTRRLEQANIERFIVAGDGNLIAITDHRRIYRSTDRSWSWEQVYQGMDNAAGQYSDMVRADDSTLVGFLNGTHVVLSSDNGQNWQQLSNIFFLSENIRSISAQSPTTWFITTTRNVFRTTDRGVTWNYVNEDFEARGLQRFVYTDSLSGYQLRDGLLLQTSDGGVTWESMDIFGFGIVVAIEAGPHLGSAVYCLSIGRYLVNKSTDNGGTWNISLTESAFPNAEPVCMSFIDERTGFIGGDGGRVLRTEDGGQSWSIVHGLGYIGTVSDVRFRDENFGIATTYSETILLTTNGGQRWNEAVPSADHSIREISLSPGGVVYLVGVDSENNFDVFRSTDDGLSWRVVGRLPLDYQITQPESIQSLHALSDDELYAGATYGILMHSIDGGQHWDRSVIGNTAMNPYGTGAEIFFFPPATIIYIRSNSVDVSTDGGANWDSRYTPSHRSLIRTQFVTPDIGYALLPSEFAKTTDGGRNWTFSTGFYPTMLHFFDARSGVVLWNNPQDEKGYLMRTVDGGDSWQRYSTNERANWNNWFWLSDKVGWAYGYGGLIRRTDNGGIASARDQLAIPGDLTLLPGYPNPFAASTHMNFTVPVAIGQRSAVSLTLHDMLGRMVVEIDAGELDAGVHSITLTRKELGTLQQGLYLYRVQAADEMRSGKLLLQ